MHTQLVINDGALLINWYVEAAAAYHGEPIFWWITAVVLLLTVSLGIVDIDFSVSSYVVRHYQETHQATGCRKCFRRLFKPLHVMFRITEVWMRLLVLAGIMQIRYELFGKDDFILYLTVVIDYGIGVHLLFRNAPAQEGALVHIFAGIGLLVSDLGHFIDLPNFALAAREISRRLAWLRFAQILLLLGVYHWVFWNQDVSAFGRILNSVQWIYATSIVYYLMRYSRPIWKVGSDLHTASLDGDLPLVKALLKPDQNGQVLDVNAASKDGQSMTPLMLAAQSGHVEVMAELLHNGAKVGARSALREDTALHFAASSKKVEACTLLIRHRADINVRNRAGQKALHIAKSSMLLQRSELIQVLTHGVPLYTFFVRAGAGCRCRLPVAGAGCRLPVAGCRLPVAGCRLPVPVAGGRLPGAGGRLPGAGCRCRFAGCRVPVAGCRLPGAGCRLPVAGCRCRLPAAGCQLPVAVGRLPFAGCRLPVPVASCRLPVAGCRWPVAVCRLPVPVAGAGCRLPVRFAGCRLFVSGPDCRLPVPVAGCRLPVGCRCRCRCRSVAGAG
eukprot:s552_g32.t1